MTSVVGGGRFPHFWRFLFSVFLLLVPSDALRETMVFKFCNAPGIYTLIPSPPSDVILGHQYILINCLFQVIAHELGMTQGEYVSDGQSQSHWFDHSYLGIYLRETVRQFNVGELLLEIRSTKWRGCSSGFIKEHYFADHLYVLQHVRKAYESLVQLTLDISESTQYAVFSSSVLKLTAKKFGYKYAKGDDVSGTRILLKFP